MKMKAPRKHLVIPDTQVHPGSNLSHLTWIGKYIVDKKPDVIICLGDWADMESLSSYAKGKRGFEGRRYKKDIEASRKAMDTLLTPMNKHNAHKRKMKEAMYKPEMHLTLGNHENRINRLTECSPELYGTVSTDDLMFAESGWTVHKFLEVVTIDGVQYSHFFPRNAKGKVMQSRSGAPSAEAQARREMKSSTAGHLQGLDRAMHTTNDKIINATIAGSCYLEDFDYLTPQGTKYWRGVLMYHDVVDGEYCAMEVDLAYLCRRYAKKPLSSYMA